MGTTIRPSPPSARHGCPARATIKTNAGPTIGRLLLGCEFPKVSVTEQLPGGSRFTPSSFVILRTVKMTHKQNVLSVLASLFAASCLWCWYSLSLLLYFGR